MLKNFKKPAILALIVAAIFFGVYFAFFRNSAAAKLAREFNQAPEIKSAYKLDKLSLVLPAKDQNSVAVQIGDPNASEFVPDIKLSKWDNEVSLTLKPNIPNVPANQKTLSFEGDKIKFTTPQAEYHFYDLPAVAPAGAEAGKPNVTDGGAYEFEVIYDKKPQSNIVSIPIETKNLDFFYQPPLNQEMKIGDFGIVSCTETQCFDKNGKVTMERPENVVGSYAAYYKGGKSGDYTALGGKNYKTGKAFHIYRPQVIDAQGNKIWGELNIDTQKGLMTITVPQDFLDKAVYPVTVDPTFGHDPAAHGASIGNRNNSPTYSRAESNPASNGSLTSLSIYGTIKTGSPQFAPALYSDSSSLPNSKLAASESGTAFGDPGWITSNLSYASLVSGTQYWLGYKSGVNGAAFFFFLDTGGPAGSFQYSAASVEENWPDTPSGISDFTYIVSIYATYTAAASCGDGTCNGDETCVSCPSDCGTCMAVLRQGVILKRNVIFGRPAWACGDSVTFTYNGSSVTYGTVASASSTCWLDRNLGASGVAASTTDSAAYGDLFQWGREDDGHQVRSPAPGNVEGDMTLTAQPGHANFIKEQTSPYDWATTTWITRWTVADDDPCPSGWHVPTKTEWDTEQTSWSPQNSTGAFASPLKLTMAGFRYYSSASLNGVGIEGDYWSSTATGGNAYYMYFYSGGAGVSNGIRASGFPVRCLKD